MRVFFQIISRHKLMLGAHPGSATDELIAFRLEFRVNAIPTVNPAPRQRGTPNGAIPRCAPDAWTLLRSAASSSTNRGTERGMLRDSNRFRDVM